MAAQAVIKRHSGESEMEFQSRKLQTLDLREQANRPLVNEFQERQGDYRDRFIHHDETGTKAQAKVNRGGSSIDRWLVGGAFDQGAQKAIQHVQGLWERASPTDHDPSRLAVGSRAVLGLSQHEALTALSEYKRKIPSKYWSVFEDVARHHVDASRAGLALCGNDRSAVDAARTATGFCASLVAMWEGF